MTRELQARVAHRQEQMIPWSNSFDAAFADLTVGKSPYEYQRRMAEHLVDGAQDVLLTAPTGCGKTWATLAPFLYARKTGRRFAD